MSALFVTPWIRESILSQTNNLRKHKPLQILRVLGGEQMIVSDGFSEIPCTATQPAIQAFQRRHPHRTLFCVRGGIVQVARYRVEFRAEASDFALTLLDFEFVGCEHSSCFGRPVPTHTDPALALIRNRSLRRHNNPEAQPTIADVFIPRHHHDALALALRAFLALPAQEPASPVFLRDTPSTSATPSGSGPSGSHTGSTAGSTQAPSSYSHSHSGNARLVSPVFPVPTLPSQPPAIPSPPPAVSVTSPKRLWSLPRQTPAPPASSPKLPALSPRTPSPSPEALSLVAPAASPQGVAPPSPVAALSPGSCEPRPEDVLCPGSPAPPAPSPLPVADVDVPSPSPHQAVAGLPFDSQSSGRSSWVSVYLSCSSSSRSSQPIVALTAHSLPTQASSLVPSQCPVAANFVEQPPRAAAPPSPPPDSLSPHTPNRPPKSRQRKRKRDEGAAPDGPVGLWVEFGKPADACTTASIFERYLKSRAL